MRKKLVAVAIALGAAWFALTPSRPLAATCTGFLVCCPGGPCYCCLHPCPIQCP
jgi:hypothetical protein